MPSIHEEEVTGTIIGGDEREYQFWTHTQPQERIATQWCADDDQAIAWFRQWYPVEFAAGAEMRVRD